MGWIKNIFRPKKKNRVEYLKIDERTLEAVTKNPEEKIIQTVILECFPPGKTILS